LKIDTRIIGSLAFSIVVIINALWLILNEEDRSSDESVFLYFSIISTQKLQQDPVSILSTYFNTITFRPPLISLQVIPWLLSGFNPPVAAFISQSIWLLLIYISCSIFLNDRFSPLLAFSLVALTPYFTSQIRELHTDLGCAALTLATYVSFLSLKKAKSNKVFRSAACFALSLGFGFLMRPDFIINIAPLLILILYLYIDRNYIKIKVFFVACIFSSIIFLPWYVKNWHNFSTWFFQNALIGKLSIYEIFLSRIEILMFFSLGTLISIFPLLLFYMRGIKDRLKCKWSSEDFLVISGLIIIAFHLIIDISSPTRTRMLMSASALIVVGVISAKVYTAKTIFITLFFSASFACYLSFFYTPNQSMRNVGIVNSIPHKSSYKSQHNDILASCKEGKIEVRDRKISLLVQPYGIFTYESMLLTSTKDRSIAISTDLFTPPHVVFDYSSFDCFLIPLSPPDNSNRMNQYKSFLDYARKNKNVVLRMVISDYEGKQMGLYIK
jgi:4-amino-4-deoxy-L-arabinose transferase-like glycosyltransferase